MLAYGIENLKSGFTAIDSPFKMQSNASEKLLPRPPLLASSEKNISRMNNTKQDWHNVSDYNEDWL